MKTHPSPRVMSRRGMTLLELTVVIVTLIAFVSLMFAGARVWKKGSDRAGCLLAIRNVQLATRSYQNMYGYDYGGHPAAGGGSQDIARHLFAMGYIEQRTYDEIRGIRSCPGGGKYHCPAPDLFPQLGDIYVECSLSASDRHIPSSPESW